MFGRRVASLRSIARSLLGSRKGRCLAKAARRKSHDLITSLQLAQSKWPEPHCAETPERLIFVLSAGWRSGSTLLQRMLMASGEALIWGDYPRAVASDETGVRIEGISAQHWVFRAPGVVLHEAAFSRGAQVVRDLMGGHRPAFWTSDRYRRAFGRRHQIPGQAPDRSTQSAPSLPRNRVQTAGGWVVTVQTLITAANPADQGSIDLRPAPRP